MYILLTFHSQCNTGRFARLNICSFSFIKVFAEIFSHCLGQKCLLFSIIKERCLYSKKNFRGSPENCEKCENLAQQIFPHLWYHINALVFLSDLRCESVTSKKLYRNVTNN